MGKRDERYEYYSNNLSNFKTVLQDTNEDITYFDEDSYNCMGYALGTFEWEALDSFVEIEREDPEFLADITLECVAELEDNFEYLRRIERPEDVLDNEYAIAFRMGYDDFHFLRQNSDGSWTHKPGNNVIQTISKEEVFSFAWCPQRFFPYVSEIYFFAVRY